MNLLFKSIKDFLSSRFNLHEDKVDESVIVEAIRKNVDFKGVNLWALIFAIFIASIGLNVNSTAVIIGAMLISPIMGPVMGIGLGIGTNNLQLVKKGAKNLLVATLISILTSTVYFTISPLHEAQSELLARTSPSIWDVFIAFFGGMAGMVAASRREKSNVVPGVAIATALMPPLCTAGFGVATGNWYYFLGAIYLYFINSVFIAIATFLMSRYLGMEKLHLSDPRSERRVTRYMIIIVIVTILPSIVMAYRIVDKSIFEANARKFIDEQFHFKDTQVVSRSYNYNNKVKVIDVLLLGEELNKPATDKLIRNLNDYNLRGVKLVIRQGLNAKQQIDLSQIKASILEDVFNGRQQSDTVITPLATQTLPNDTMVLAELKVLYPALRSFGISQMVTYSKQDTLRSDTAQVALVHFASPLRKADLQKLELWLKVRYQSEAIQVISH